MFNWPVRKFYLLGLVSVWKIIDISLTGNLNRKLQELIYSIQRVECIMKRRRPTPTTILKQLSTGEVLSLMCTAHG